MVVVQLKDHPMTQPDAGLDTTAYATLAQQVLAGDVWLNGQAYFVSPLYIYVLAAGLGLTHSYTAVRLLQIALGTIAVWFVILTAREWFGRRAGWIAGILAGLTGLLTFYESLILQASLDAFLTAAALLALTLGLRSNALPRGFAPAGPPTASLAGPPKPRSAPPTRSLPLARFATQRPTMWFLVSGIVLGLATLNRPNILAAAMGVALMALATRRLKPAALLVAGLAIGMAPVTLRNMLVLHDGSLVSSHGGLNFYIGNGDGATGFYRQVEGISPTIAGQEKDTREQASKALGRTVTTAEASDYFYGLAWQHIRERPGATIALFVKKFGYVFHAQHIALPYSFPFYAYDENTALRYYAAGPWLLIPLGLLGLCWPLVTTPGVVSTSLPGKRLPGSSVATLAPDRSAYLVWLAFVPAYAAGVAVFFVAERYRLPILIPMLIGAGAAVDALWQAIVDRRAREIIVSCALLAVTFTVVNWKHGLHDGRWEEGLGMAERLVTLGRYDEADARLKRIEPGEPQPGMARYAVAAQLLNVGQPARAAEVVRHLVPAGNAGPEFLLRVGRLAAQAHAPDVADPFFKRGAELAPTDAAARQQYGLNLVLLGRLEEAAIELTEALRLAPRDPDSLAHLSYCEAKLGRLDDARRHADDALAVQPDNALARQVRAAIR
ncbi:MAG TPA: tetratricopeptide repeat protein [Vicinamibacterales bacterium]|nr:tetratricopeptide repeat protein [Vicinamibacterales bacterium]